MENLIPKNTLEITVSGRVWEDNDGQNGEFVVEFAGGGLLSELAIALPVLWKREAPLTRCGAGEQT